MNVKIVSKAIKSALIYIAILCVVSMITKESQAKGLKINLSNGFARHFAPSKNYNDSVFKDNLTSTNTILTLSYKGVDFSGLSDSQGNLSFALTNNVLLDDNDMFKMYFTWGTYILRKEGANLLPSIDAISPDLRVGDRTWAFTPLLGMSFDIPLTDLISTDVMITPAFLIFGLKIKLK